MQSLNFEDGLKCLAINGDENRVIVVNPTDVGIVKRYKEKFPEIEKLSKDFFWFCIDTFSNSFSCFLQCSSVHVMITSASVLY